MTELFSFSSEDEVKLPVDPLISEDEMEMLREGMAPDEFKLMRDILGEVLSRAHDGKSLAQYMTAIADMGEGMDGPSQSILSIGESYARIAKGGQVKMRQVLRYLEELRQPDSARDEDLNRGFPLPQRLAIRDGNAESMKEETVELPTTEPAVTLEEQSLFKQREAAVPYVAEQSIPEHEGELFVHSSDTITEDSVVISSADLDEEQGLIVEDLDLEPDHEDLLIPSTEEKSPDLQDAAPKKKVEKVDKKEKPAQYYEDRKKRVQDYIAKDQQGSGSIDIVDSV